jgi:hypothetical protein
MDGNPTVSRCEDLIDDRLAQLRVDRKRVNVFERSHDLRDALVSQFEHRGDDGHFVVVERLFAELPVQADKGLEFGLLVRDALFFAEETVEEFGDRVSDRELDVHQGEDERRGDGADAESVPCADRCGPSVRQYGIEWYTPSRDIPTLRDDFTKDDDEGRREDDGSEAAAENTVEEDG